MLEFVNISESGNLILVKIDCPPYTTIRTHCQFKPLVSVS